jgi:hypothetical protein
MLIPGTPYTMLITNTARFLRGQDPNKPGAIDAFRCSEVLGIALCTDKEHVLEDLITVKLD